MTTKLLGLLLLISASCLCEQDIEPKPFAKVVVLGAAGGIGQPLSLLLKMNPLIKHLSLYDIHPTKGIARDLSSIYTSAHVHGYHGEKELADALKDADVVVCVAGVTIKPGQTRDDVFETNAPIIKQLITAVADHCPNAFVAIVSNPVNSLVPLVYEVLVHKKIHGVRKRLFGVTTMDVVRAKKFAPGDVDVPVVGGHQGITIIPLVSGSSIPNLFDSENLLSNYIKDIQDEGIKVLDAKDGKGTATLSMAYAAARFTNSLLWAKNGRPTVECAYVHSHLTKASFFASPVTIGKEGIEKIDPQGILKKITPFESKLVNEAIDKLKDDILKGRQEGKKLVKNEHPKKNEL